MRSAVIYSSDFLSRFRVHFHTRFALGWRGFDSRQRAQFLPVCPPDRALACQAGSIFQVGADHWQALTPPARLQVGTDMPAIALH